MFKTSDYKNFYQLAYDLSGNNQQSKELVELALEEYLKSKHAEKDNHDFFIHRIKHNKEHFFEAAPEEEFKPLGDDIIDGCSQGGRCKVYEQGHSY